MITANILPAIAKRHRRRYRVSVAANSVTGFGHPIKQKAHKRHQRTAGAFFVPAIRLYGGCVWEAFAPAGFLLPRLTNLHTAATHSFGHERGGSSAKGAVPMKHARNPSTPNSHADAYKAMALAALRADSSLSVRLARYNHHMAKARALEAAGGAV
jgi:hypothetical protein